MTSGGGTFSAEEVAYLKTLPAVADATARRITYTEAFKAYCVERYGEGVSPVSLFREAGLDPSLIGYKRIECAIARWRKAMGVPTVRKPRSARTAPGTTPFSPGKAPLAGEPVLTGEQGDIRDLLIYQQVRRIDELERQVLDLSSRLEQLDKSEVHPGA
ncbi:hypothetical protein [Bifidobacterium cuniculi]|uniref:Transposase n=1 Tax=Bifidobacterium cuniculi TaxID=1688 RepID=A0A087AIH0_9BIFI|nr:hypothetical protein [Bifidobacterium cuniculi]KFI58570.1 hypothetical protein BCUN_1748 [Bifidobacterium cuniculi]